MSRKLVVEIIGDSSGLQRSLAAASAATDSFGGRMSAAGARISAFGAEMTRDVTLPIVGLGAVATKAAIDFQNSMELLHTQAGVSQRSVEALSKSVLAMAGSVATSPDELSKGLYHLASQGLRGKDALDALKTAAEGAKLGGADLESVTNALGATIVAGIGGVKNYQQAMGELNSIVGSGDMRMQDLADAMGTGLAAAAKTAHISLDQIGGALATFGDNNIRGAKAGTLLISTMRVLGHQSKAAVGALDDLGVSSDTLQSKLATGGLTDAIGYLKQQIEASGKAGYQVSSDLSEAFGGKQSTGIKVLIDEFERLKTKVKDVSDGGNKFASDWEAYTKTTAYHLASMGAQMQATGVTIGDVLLPVVSKIADVIGHLGARFDELSPHTRKLIEIFAGVAAAIGPIAMVVGPVIGAIGALGTAFVGLTAIVGPLAAALGAPAAVIAGLVVGIAALAAGIAAAVLFPKQFEDVLERMGLSAQTAGEIVGGLRGVFEIVKDAVMALMPIFDEVWKTIVATMKNAFEVIKGLVDVFSGLLHGNWSQLWHGIEEIVGGTLAQIGNMLHAAISLLGDAAKLIGEAIWAAIHGALSSVLNLFRALPGEILGALGDLSHLLFDEGRALIQGLMDGVKSMLGALGGLAHDVGSFFKSLKGPLPKDLQLLQPEGAAMIQGLMIGMRSQFPQLGALAGSIAPSIGAAVGASPSAAYAGAGAAGRGAQISITVNVPSGFVGSPQELGDALAVAVSRSALNGHPLWRQVVRQATA